MFLWQDLRVAVRRLATDRLFTLAAAIALGLGLAANATVFTLVNGILLSDLPVDRPDEIVTLGTRDARGRNLGVSIPDFQDWRHASRSFSDLALTAGGAFTIIDDDRPAESFSGRYASSNLFHLLGITPILGRDFRADDDLPGAEPVVILSHHVWMSRYGGNPGVLGRMLRLYTYYVTVIGVMPEGMQFPPNTDVWVPLVQATRAPVLQTENRAARNYSVYGRLTNGTSLSQADAELAVIGTRLASEHPDTNTGVVPTVLPFNRRLIGSQTRTILWSLMGAVGFVLLIACANVANLSLARSARRTQEISVRVALGASRWRIVRQLLVESVVLACLGGALGWGLGLLGVRLFELSLPDNAGLPYWMTFTMNLRVFGFLAVVCLGSGILFGLVPALQVSRTDVHDVLKEGGRSGTGWRVHRWTGALIVAELALTLVLLAGAGYMMRSFLTLYRMDIGFDSSRQLMGTMLVPEEQYATGEARVSFFQRLEERLAALSGVEAVTFATSPPLGGGATRRFAVEGEPLQDPESAPQVTTVSISPGYFDTFGLRLVRGRLFDTRDGEPGRENAIVNQQLVTMYFKDLDPIGHRIRFLVDQADTVSTQWLTIVGVAPTIRQRNLQEADPDPVVYVPHRLQQQWGTLLIVRGRSNPAELTQAIREEIRRANPDLPLNGVRTMDTYLAQTRWSSRVIGSMFTIFALIALVLAAVGIYAVTAHSVTQRTQEIGIRMVLGARPGALWWLIGRRVAIQLGVGLVIGFAGALGVGRLLQGLLVQIGPTDPLTLVGVGTILTVVAAGACVWPALRATRFDPLRALRYE